MNNILTNRFRVIATMSTQFGTKVIDTTTLWEGTDTDDLSRAYPPSNVFGADDLFQKEIEDGFIITRFTFEQQLADGSWQKIDDPRRRLTPVTDLERAIDAENRRDFPDDYVTSDCDRCGDYGCDECEDRYRVDCRSCYDNGCAKCDPNWCATCDNNGCATCDPASVCTSCKQYCDQYFRLLYKVPGLCESCEYDLSRPTCSHNCHELADGDDGLCSGCRFDLETKCSDCDYDLPNGEDGLCSNCREYEAGMRRYYVWWRRALRACKFWR